MRGLFPSLSIVMWQALVQAIQRYHLCSVEGSIVITPI